MNKILNKNYYIFFLILFSTSLLLFLSFNGHWTISHGPLYYFIAEGLYENGTFNSNILTIPRENDIFTIQIGVSFFIYIGLVIFGKNLWFIFIIFAISTIWYFCYISIYNFTKKINFTFKDTLFLFILIFFQPYNLNQIACFSNESIYFPSLIISFFTIIKICNEEKVSKVEYLFTLCVFLFGVFFRVHNIIYILSILIFFLYLKKIKFLKIFIIFTIIKIVIIILSLKFTNIQDSLPLIIEVAKEMFNQLKNISSQGELNFIETKDAKLYLLKASNALSLYSFFLFINKFSDNFYLNFIISSSFFLLFLFCFKKNISKSNHKNFYYFGLIFSILSSLFVYLIPMFEYSYLLPSSFFIIINYYSYFKMCLKKYFYKNLIILSILYSALFGLIFTGAVKLKNVEVYKYRNFFYNLKKDLSKIEYNDLVYFDKEDQKVSFQELYRFFIPQKICNFNLTPDECLKLKNINFSNRIFVIKTDGSMLNTNKFKLYKIKNITEHYYEFEKK